MSGIGREGGERRNRPPPLFGYLIFRSSCHPFFIKKVEGWFDVLCRDRLGTNVEKESSNWEAFDCWFCQRTCIGMEGLMEYVQSKSVSVNTGLNRPAGYARDTAAVEATVTAAAARL